MKNIIKLTKIQKITCLFICLLFIVTFSIAIPTFTKFKNREITERIEWDEIVATSYNSGNGDIDNPYIISNAQELAYFSEMLETTTYSGKYFKLAKDIVINIGEFSYVDNNLMYTKGTKTYYIKDDNYYSSLDSENSAGKIKILESLNNFKGEFDGDFHTIYGLYYNDENPSLFTNLNGIVKNLYIENTVANSSYISAGVAANSESATIENVVFDGVILSSTKTNNFTENIVIEPITTEALAATLTKTITTEVPAAATNVQYKLTGNYMLSNTANVELTINETAVTTDIFELTYSSMNDITIALTSDIDTTITFENLNLEITYDYSLSSGVVGVANNSTIRNVISKANIYGTVVNAGLVGVLNNSTLINAYSTGTVAKSTYYASSVGVTRGTSTIKNTYNSVSGIGLIGYTQDGELSLENDFNMSVKTNILKKGAAVINVTKCYTLDRMYDSTGKFTKTTAAKLKTESFLGSYYKTFVSLEDVNANVDNVWIYDGGYPVLYFDDIVNKYATLKINDYRYATYASEINTITLDNAKFSVIGDETQSGYHMYYYIDNSSTNLTEAELESITDWKEYSEEISIIEDGTYMIYVRVTDSNGVNTYINSDVIEINSGLVKLEIKLDDKNWLSKKENLDTIFINEPKSITLNASNPNSTIKYLGYYISSEQIQENDFESIMFTEYEDVINITSSGKYVIYAKTIDYSGNVKYSNTDFIIYDGYKATISAGKNETADSVINISDKSIAVLNFKYENKYGTSNLGVHKLIVNKLLPKGTKVTLVDNISNKVYEYNILTDEDLYGFNTNNYATYNFELFEEKGKTVKTNYVETDSEKEDYTIKIDFKTTTLTDDFLNIKPEIQKEIDSITIKTLKTEQKTINIYPNSESTQYLTVTSAENIIYNSNSVTEFNITMGLKRKNNVVDTTYDDMIQGLKIRLKDSEGNTLGKQYLKNMIFSIDNKTFYPNTNDEIIIQLNNTTDKITKTLSVETYLTNTLLTEGTYYIEITNFMSYDGKLGLITNDDIYTIPVEIKNSKIDTSIYNYNIEIDDSNKILYRKENKLTTNFTVTKSDNLNSAKIVVSLYKKDSLSGYNQDYSIVDIKDYVTNELTLYKNNSYYIEDVDGKIAINFKNDNLVNTGYMLMFEIYNDDIKIGTISEKIIVR